MKVKDYYQKDRFIGEQTNFRCEEYFPWRLDYIARKLNLKLKGNILDVGCGDGGLAAEIVKKFPGSMVFGIDISRKGCKLAKKYCVETKVTDLNKRIPYADDKFDFIISQEVLEHIIHTDNYFKEIKRVLKKKGRAVITTPNLLAWYQRILCLLGYHPTFYELSYLNRNIGLGFLNKVLVDTYPVGHIRVFTSRALVDIAHLYGFKVIDIKGAPVHYPFPPVVRQIYNILERLFSNFPSLSSNLILYLEKK